MSSWHILKASWLWHLSAWNCPLLPLFAMAKQGNLHYSKATNQIYFPTIALAWTWMQSPQSYPISLTNYIGARPNLSRSSVDCVEITPPKLSTPPSLQACALSVTSPSPWKVGKTGRLSAWRSPSPCTSANMFSWSWAKQLGSGHLPQRVHWVHQTRSASCQWMVSSRPPLPQGWCA